MVTEKGLFIVELGLPRSVSCTKIIDDKKVNGKRRNNAKKILEEEKNGKRKTIVLGAKRLGFRQLTAIW